MASLIFGQSVLEEGAVGRHLVLAVGAQDAARLAVDGQAADFRRDG